MTRLAARLAKLERTRPRPEACDGMGNTHPVWDADTLDAALVPRCRTCGGRHVVFIREMIVEPNADGELVVGPRSRS